MWFQINLNLCFNFIWKLRIKSSIKVIPISAYTNKFPIKSVILKFFTIIYQQIKNGFHTSDFSTKIILI